MPNTIINGNNLSVHGRGSLKLEYKAYAANGTTQVDASGWALWFEVDGVPIREKLVADPSDALGQMVILENSQIITLKLEPCPWIIRDETTADEEVVVQEGTIARYGYIGTPDTTVG